MRFPGFIGPSYTSQSVNVDCQRSVNLFPEINELGTGKEREVASLVSTPGLRELVELPTYPIRGEWRASNGELFVVSGAKLYRVSDAWVATELGSLNTSSGPVSMADNGTYVVLVDGTDGFSWKFDPGTYAEITDDEFFPADIVTYQDGYFIFNRSGTGQFFFVDDAGLDFDALDFSSAAGSPDILIGHINAHQNLYLFGPQTTEVFYNTGDGSSPWMRQPGALADVGCAAAHSIAKLNNSVYWIGGDSTGSGIVYRMQGYQPQRVSTPAIEAVIRAISTDDLSNARAWTYQQGGHHFYCLNLPGVSATWVYDATTSMWHERTFSGSWGLERHRAECHAVAHGQNVVGDYENGKLYALDPDVYTDDGTVITRIRRAPHFSKEGARISHHSFWLDMETGVGLDGVGQGTDPQVMIRWSDDGGHTWSQERQASIGRIGKFSTRAIVRRLGQSRDRVYEVKVTDPVKVVLIGANLDVSEGAA